MQAATGRAVLVAVLIVVAGMVAVYAAARGDGPAHAKLYNPATAAPPTAAMAPVGPTPEAADDRLLPNLASLPAEDVIIEMVDDTRRLRFTSIIANTGVGPVETVPDDEVGCPPGQRHVSQRLYHDVDGDGQFAWDVDVDTTLRPAGCMLDHADHDHWHFDAAARYVLTEPRSTTPIVSADKVSFCWRDNREVPAEADPGHEQHYGDCGYDEVQGIMPGWADVYSNDLADQHLDLPDDLADGLYCLWNEADPYRLLVESDESDNAAVRAIELAGTTVTMAPPERCAGPPPR
jgi:hypothetical protein